MAGEARRGCTVVMTARELLAAARRPRGGGRGRPRGKTAERSARDQAVLEQIGKLLRRPRSRGALTALQQEASRRYGIAPRDFYRLVQRAKVWHQFTQRIAAATAGFGKNFDAAMRRMAADGELIERHISSSEWERWQHRDGAAVARLARMRARRAPPKKKTWRDYGREPPTWADVIGRGK